MDLRVLEERVCEVEKRVQELLREIGFLKKSGQIAPPQYSAVTEADIVRQREIARRMREARDKMPPLGMSIKEMVEEGRS